MVDSARGMLDYVNDINIAAVHYQGDKSGLSPGFAISLLAKTTTSAFYSAELAGGAGQAPEDVGLQAARMLLSEIRKGGCVDSISQTLVLLMMVLGPNDVSKVRVGELTPFTYVNSCYFCVECCFFFFGMFTYLDFFIFVTNVI